MTEPVRILGIDPGLRVTGFGVIEKRGNKLTYVASGCIKSQGDDGLPERIRTLFAGISEVVAT
ncbi:MAG: crossover junction endodeoxyribonuclease RuvC, partial [Betaproteobacteria bacterium]